jgi:hypothetical protein
VTGHQDTCGVAKAIQRYALGNLTTEIPTK